MLLDVLDGIAAHPWRDHCRNLPKVPTDSKERQDIGMTEGVPMGYYLPESLILVRL